MRFAVRRTPQRYDQDVEATPLEGCDLLRDEGLREPRIALEYERDAFRPRWRLGAVGRVLSRSQATYESSSLPDGVDRLSSVLRWYFLRLSRTRAPGQSSGI